MNYRKTRTWICVLFSICILFSGMCFDAVKADSFSSFTDSQKIAAFLQKSKSQISNHDVCTEKLVGVRNVKNIITEHVRNYKKSIYKDTYVSLPGIHLIPSFYLSNAETALLGHSSTSSRAYIIHYIHCQDGEKIISSIL